MRLLLGATNCPWDIDDAVFRTGRFDEKIFVGLPDEEARLGILKMHLEGIQCEESLDVPTLAQRLDGYTGSDIVGIVNAAKRACLTRSVRDNAEPQIAGVDLDRATQSIPASATGQLMKRYTAFMEARS